MSVGNSLNTETFPNNGISIYVSQESGSDTIGTGSIFSPLATMNAALALCRDVLPGTYFFINVVDSSVYDEIMVLDFGLNIYAPAAVFSSSLGDTITASGSGVVVNASVIQSTGGLAWNNTAGYPIITINASFGGNFVNNAPGTTMTINANTIFGSISNPGSGSKSIINLAAPIGGTTDAATFCPWSNTLTPAS